MFLELLRFQGPRRRAQLIAGAPGRPHACFSPTPAWCQFKTYFLGEEKRPYTPGRQLPEVRPRRGQAQRPGKRRLHRPAPHLLRDAGEFLLRRLFQGGGHRHGLGAPDRKLGCPRSASGPRCIHEDDEARASGRRSPASPDRIVRLGEKDNFWAMGDTGPCGPCSEILFDQGEDDGLRPATAPSASATATATWRSGTSSSCSSTAPPTAKLTPLPKPNIDTGMGLERLAAVLQGVTSNFDTDLFRPHHRPRRGTERPGATAGTEKRRRAFRVIADHGRATAFLMADGVLPVNEGRGTCCGASCAGPCATGASSACTSPFYREVRRTVVGRMGEVYPNSSRPGAHRPGGDQRRGALRRDPGPGPEAPARRSGGLKAGASAILPGEAAFSLYDTYGFPRT